MSIMSIIFELSFSDIFQWYRVNYDDIIWILLYDFDVLKKKDS